jgi:hypothetical protein
MQVMNRSLNCSRNVFNPFNADYDQAASLGFGS